MRRPQRKFQWERTAQHRKTKLLTHEDKKAIVRTQINVTIIYSANQRWQKLSGCRCISQRMPTVIWPVSKNAVLASMPMHVHITCAYQNEGRMIDLMDIDVNINFSGPQCSHPLSKRKKLSSWKALTLAGFLQTYHLLSSLLSDLSSFPPHFFLSLSLSFLLSLLLFLSLPHSLLMSLHFSNCTASYIYIYR